MFASTTVAGNVIDGVLMCHIDPNPLLPKKETWHPGAILRDDIENYAFHGKHPEVFFISCIQEGSPPFVLVGYISVDNSSFIPRSVENDNITLQFEKFLSENNDVIKRRNERIFLPVICLR